MSSFNFFNGIAAYLLVVCAFCLFFAACSKSDTVEVVNPDNKWLDVDGMQVREVHPKPGVTCYVAYSSISCLKD